MAGLISRGGLCSAGGLIAGINPRCACGGPNNPLPDDDTGWTGTFTVNNEADFGEDDFDNRTLAELPTVATPGRWWVLDRDDGPNTARISVVMSIEDSLIRPNTLGTGFTAAGCLGALGEPQPIRTLNAFGDLIFHLENPTSPPGPTRVFAITQSGRGARRLGVTSINELTYGGFRGSVLFNSSSNPLPQGSGSEPSTVIQVGNSESPASVCVDEARRFDPATLLVIGDRPSPSFPGAWGWQFIFGVTNEKDAQDRDFRYYGKNATYRLDINLFNFTQTLPDDPLEAQAIVREAYAAHLLEQGGGGGVPESARVGANMDCQGCGG